MFGFFVGALGVAGLIALLVRGSCRGRRGGLRGGRGRWFMRRVFDRLETTPGQEKVIREEVDRLRNQVRDFRQEFRASRADVARVLRGETFDETIFGDAFTRHDDRLRDMRLETVGALARIHDALDESQRDRLAGLVEGGFFRGGFRGHDGPYRASA